jgi:hypothetical protein
MNALAAKKMQPQGIEEFTSGLQKYIEQRGFREHWVEAQLGMSTRAQNICLLAPFRASEQSSERDSQQRVFLYAMVRRGSALREHICASQFTPSDHHCGRNIDTRERRTKH